MIIGNKVQLVIFRVITINTFATLLCSTSEVIQMLTAWLLFHLTIAGILIMIIIMITTIIIIDNDNNGN